MLDGVRRALEADGGFVVVGETQTGAEVLALVTSTSPDLVLLDVRMPDVDGIACLVQIREHFPGLKVVMLSASTSTNLVDTALRHGASGYITKSIDPVDLPARLRRVMAGEILRDVGPDEGPGHEAVSAGGLTDRETAILQAVARGRSNAEIARELWITPQTVKFHLTNTYRKLGARNRTEATRVAYERGLIDNPFFGAD